MTTTTTLQWVVENVPNRFEVHLPTWKKGAPDSDVTYPVVLNFMDMMDKDLQGMTNVDAKAASSSNSESDLSEAEEDNSEVAREENINSLENFKEANNNLIANRLKPSTLLDKLKKKKIRVDEYDLDDPFVDDSEMPDFDMNDMQDSGNSAIASHLTPLDSSFSLNGSRRRPRGIYPKPEQYFVYCGILDLKSSKRKEDNIVVSFSPRKSKKKAASKNEEKLKAKAVKSGKMKSAFNVTHVATKKSKKIKPEDNREDLDLGEGAINNTAEKKLKLKTAINITTPNIKESKKSSSAASPDITSPSGTISEIEGDYSKYRCELLLSDYKAYIRSLSGKVDLRDPETISHIKRIIQLAITIPGIVSSASKLADYLAINPKGHASFKKQLMENILPALLTEINSLLELKLQNLHIAVDHQIAESATGNNGVPNEEIPPLSSSQDQSGSLSNYPQISTGSTRLRWSIELKQILVDSIEMMVASRAIADFLRGEPVRPMQLRMQVYVSLAASHWPSTSISPNEIAKVYNGYRKKILKDIQKTLPTDPSSSNSISQLKKSPKKKINASNIVTSSATNVHLQEEKIVKKKRPVDTVQLPTPPSTLTASVSRSANANTLLLDTSSSSTSETVINSIPLHFKRSTVPSQGAGAALPITEQQYVHGEYSDPIPTSPFTGFFPGCNFRPNGPIVLNPNVTKPSSSQLNAMGSPDNNA